MAQMSQSEVDAWIAAHGGRDLQHGVEQKQVKNPSYNPDKGPTPSNQEYMTVEVETWKNSKTGAMFSAKHMPDGSWDRYDSVDADPNKPAGNDGPPGGKPYIDEEGPNGRRLGWNPTTKQYDRDLGSSPSAQAAAAATPKEEVNPSDPTRLRKPDGKGGWVDAGPNAAGVQAAADRNKPVVTIKEDASGRLVSIQTFPDGRTPVITPLGVQGTPQQVKGPDGNTYERGADGTYKPVVGVPDTRAPYTGPKLPQIVLGHSAEALQALGDQLARDSSLTPAQREKMWGEAIQTANVAVAEAGVLQRERESNLNAQVNLATTRLKSENDNFTTALKFATDLNDKLPAGSPLGGQAFAAMLGMQMIAAHRSGIYDIKPPGTPVADAAARPAPTTPPVLANIGNRAAVEAQRQEVAAQTAQVAQQRSAPSGDAQVGNPNVAPKPAARPTPAALAAASPGSEDALLQQNQVAAAAADSALSRSGESVAPGAPSPMDANGQPTVFSPVPPPFTPPASARSGAQGGAPTPQTADGNESPDDILTVAELGPDGQRTGRTVQVTRSEYSTSLANDPSQATTTVVDNAVPNPSRSAAPPSTPDYGQPGMRVLPQPPEVSPLPAGEQSMASPSPASQFAVLAPYRPQQSQPAAPMASGVDMRQSPALLHAQAASKPPWRMSPAEIAQYEAAGVDPEVIYGVPGRAA